MTPVPRLILVRQALPNGLSVTEAGADDPDQQFYEPRAIGHPRKLGDNELKIALNRGEIRAHLIGLPELQTVFGIVGKPGHSARIAVEVGGQFV
jgi:hypothetical protein